MGARFWSFSAGALMGAVCLGLLLCWAGRLRPGPGGQPIGSERIGSLRIQLTMASKAFIGGDPAFTVYLTNEGDADLAIPRHRASTFRVRIWDRTGHELTNYAAYWGRVDMGCPVRWDWVTLAPREALGLYRVPLDAYGQIRGLRRGRYRATVSLAGQGRQNAIPDPAPGDGQLVIWKAPEGETEVAAGHFTVR